MSSPASHTLRIRCPTWDHLENFYERKIKDGNVLLARVPFSPKVESEITIALELPDGLVVDIEAKVTGVRQAPDGRKSAIRMELRGMDTGISERLGDAVARGRRGGQRQRPLSEAAPPQSRTQTGLPVPIPADVPIDELVPPVLLPAIDDVPELHREQYRLLDQQLRSLREKAAHEVLGVAWDAEVPEIRLGYFKLIKAYHPDVVARHDSPEISLLASEIFIYINKAYDRLRDSAVAAGKAIIAGPALLPHQGWLADFDDIGTVKPRRPLRSDDLSGPTRALPAKALPASEATVPPALIRNARGALNAPNESTEISVKFSAAEKTAPVREEAEVLEPLPPAPIASIHDAGLFDDARHTERGMTPLGGEADPSQLSDGGASVQELIASGEEALSTQDYEAARTHFAGALEQDPRNRAARALYHVAYGHTLLQRDKGVEAMTQFEVALKHDPDCRYAKAAKAAAGGVVRQKRPSLFKRLFGR